MIVIWVLGNSFCIVIVMIWDVVWWIFLRVCDLLVWGKWIFFDFLGEELDFELDISYLFWGFNIVYFYRDGFRLNFS